MYGVAHEKLPIIAADTDLQRCPFRLRWRIDCGADRLAGSDGPCRSAKQRLAVPIGNMVADGHQRASGSADTRGKVWLP
ncbi:MAG: hypothetical protein PVF70_07495, partial [Anaerolineales bacterium]